MIALLGGVASWRIVQPVQARKEGRKSDDDDDDDNLTQVRCDVFMITTGLTETLNIFPLFLMQLKFKHHYINPALNSILSNA